MKQWPLFEKDVDDTPGPMGRTMALGASVLILRSLIISFTRQHQENEKPGCL